MRVFGLLKRAWQSQEGEECGGEGGVHVQQVGVQETVLCLSFGWEEVRLVLSVHQLREYGRRRERGEENGGGGS